ncbi:MAG: hypothetical protein ACFFCI_12155 [Promethearchaeota archaeon]
MPQYLSESSLQQFFSEIFLILRETDPKLTEVWCELSKISFLKNFTKLELVEYFTNFESISLKKGNYIDYIVINKILFIIECINFLTYDIKDLSEVLDYSGFEALIKEILLKNNYISITNFRFSSYSQFKPLPSQKRFEIDVIGIYLKYILIIDAKQWKRKDSFSSLNKAANLQFHRVKVLSKNPEIFLSLVLKILGNFADLKRHLPFTIIPMMVTLEDNSIKLSENQMPLVSIYEFNSFLHELPKNLQYFKTVQVNNVNLQQG